MVRGAVLVVVMFPLLSIVTLAPSVDRARMPCAKELMFPVFVTLTAPAPVFVA